MEEQRQVDAPQNYYFIIPARMITEGVPHATIILYGVISSLVSVEGFCWATNKYLAQKAGIGDHKRIYKHLADLQERGYITQEVSKVTSGYARKIWLAQTIKGSETTVPPQINGEGGHPQIDVGVTRKSTYKELNNSNKDIVTVSKDTVTAQSADDAYKQRIDPEVQAVYEGFERAMELKMRRQADQRRFAKLLLREHPAAQLIQSFEFYATHRKQYTGVPQALDLKEFYYKYNAIKAFFEDIGSKNRKPRFRGKGGLAVA